MRGLLSFSRGFEGLKRGPRLNSAERRRYERFQVGAPAALFIMGYRVPLPAALANLCQGGCFVSTEAAFRAGSSVEVSFRAAGDQCGGNGIVVRDEAGRGVGVEFSGTNDALLAFVRQFDAADAEARGTLVAGVSEVEIRVR